MTKFYFPEERKRSQANAMTVTAVIPVAVNRLQVILRLHQTVRKVKKKKINVAKNPKKIRCVQEET